MTTHRTPNEELDFAIRESNYDAIVRLIDNGVDVNEYNIYMTGGSTFHHLYDSIYFENLEIIKYLVSRGADINQVSGPLKWTALHRAATLGHFEIAKFLLESGADNKMKDDNGNTAADLADYHMDSDMVEYIRSYEFELVKGVQCDG